MSNVQLNDSAAFDLVSGLWTGIRSPLKKGRVLRSTNFDGDGLLDFTDVVELDVEARHATARQLKDGDIIIERSGGGPKQPVGRVALFNAPDGQAYFSSNFTTALRIRDQEQFDPEFVSLYLHALYLNGATETLQRATTGIRNLDWQGYLSLDVPLYSKHEQVKLATVIGRVRRCYRIESKLLEVLSELKKKVMTDLFTFGSRDDSQKETEIGLMPASWVFDSIGSHHSVVSGGTPSRGNPAFWNGGEIPWVKTTEVKYCTIFKTEEHITAKGLASSAAKLLPVGTLLMAMYGQGTTRGKVAILGIEAACNQACAAIFANDQAIQKRYLYHYLSWRYEAIRTLAHGGQQQNLNLEIVRQFQVAYPTTEVEQNEIVAILDAIDAKIEQHRKKHETLEHLFKALLHKLMAGEIRASDLDLSVLDSTATPQLEVV